MATETEARVREVLSYLSPNCDRYTWAEVICPGIKNALGDAGHSVWHDWSSAGDSYKLGEAEAVWRSWSEFGKRTFASVVKLAQAEGYDPKKGKYTPPTPEQKAALEAKAIEAAKAAAIDRQSKADKAREIGKKMLNDPKARPATAADPYNELKGIQPHGLLIGPWTKRVKDAAGKWTDLVIENVLYVKIVDRKGDVHGVQGITAEGEKIHLPGVAKKGHFSPLKGTVPGMVLAEGWATACSIHEATGRTVLCCFDVGNMLHVAKAIFEADKEKAKTVTIAADNDTETEAQGHGNPGRTVASNAGLLYGMKVAVPPPGDFNDLVVKARAEGLPAEKIAAMVQKMFDDAKVPPEAYKPATPVVLGAAGGVAGQASETDGSVAPAGRKTGRADPKPVTFGAPVDLFSAWPAPPLPLDAFPPSIADYARDQGKLLGCDPSIVAMSALVAAAACIHDDIQVQPKEHDPTWTESARLWVVFVGDPSTYKSPAIKKGIGRVRAAEAASGAEHAAAEAEFKRQHEAWKSLPKDEKNASPEPKPPSRKRRIVEDTTVEALTGVLADNPAGVLVYQDELTGWFGSMDAYKAGGRGGADRAHWLEAYNGGPRLIDRSGKGLTSVPNWSVCMVGGIQQGPMKRLASGSSDDGLLQRFMVVIARSAVDEQDLKPDFGVKGRFDRLFEQLLALQPTSRPVTLDEGARYARKRVIAAAKKMMGAFDHPQMKAWLGKWSGLFARLLLTFHVIGCAEEGVYPTSRPISAATAERVERLMCEGLVHHGIHFYRDLVDAHDRHEHQVQLARLVLVWGKPAISRRDIERNWKAARSLKPMEFQEVIGALCNLQWIAPDDSVGHDGKPNRWAVNPKVHQMFIEQAEAERLRRDAASQIYRELREGLAANDPAPKAA